MSVSDDGPVSPPDRAELLLTLDRARLAHELLRGIAHDLRNSMQVLALAGALGPDAGGDLSHRVDQAIDEMTATLDLLSRLGRHPGAEAPFADPVAVLHRVEQLARFQRNIADVPVRLELAPGLPRVRVAEFALTQAVLNVVTNAKEVQPLGRAVTVTAATTPNGEQVEIAVEDGGPGAPADAGRPLVTTKSPAQHGGTGLFAARTLLERSGGGLRWEPVAGGGTRVVIRVPVAGTGAVG